MTEVYPQKMLFARTNGKTAISMHARTKHEKVFDLQNFNITPVNKCSPKQSTERSFRLLISIGQKSGESIDTKTSIFTLGTADDN